MYSTTLVELCINKSTITYFICCINDNIVKLFLGMLLPTRKLFDVQCCQSVIRSMIRYVGILDNYVNCITCIYKIFTGYRLAVYIKDP